ncbi:hypothetical protein, partial [Aliiruegeria lutimaris]
MPLDMAKPQSLADVLDRLTTRDGGSTRHRDQISAVRRVAEMLGRAPADLPCDAPGLRMYLDRIHPAQHQITARTLSNIKANLAAALRAARAIPRNAPKVPRTAAWEEFFLAADAKHQVWSLSRLATYCAWRGLQPADVTDEVMAEFQNYLDARLLTKDPTKLCKEMAQIWNGIVKRNDLPFTRLSYEKGGRHRCRPLSTYPEPLQAEIQTYLGQLRHDDPFDTSGPEEALRPTSVRNVEAHLRQFLDALAEAGEEPTGMKSLANVVTAENMKAAFRVIMERAPSDKIPPACNNIAATLVAIARHHLKLSELDLKEILAVKKVVQTKPRGMSAKNSDRLAQFNDWENVLRIVGLPATLMDEADRSPHARKGALNAMHAVAIAILLSCPMRAKNLAGLDLERHIKVHRSGTHTRYTIRIEGIEVKNGEPIEVRLNNRVSRLLHRYITVYRPLVSRAQGTALFP